MFKRKTNNSESTPKTNPDLELDAYFAAVRERNKVTVNSTLGELVRDQTAPEQADVKPIAQTPLEAIVPDVKEETAEAHLVASIENLSPTYEDDMLKIMRVVSDHFKAAHEAGVRYDPFDDDTLIGAEIYPLFVRMPNEDAVKKATDLIVEYIKVLENSAKDIIQLPPKIGRHATADLVTIKNETPFPSIRARH